MRAGGARRAAHEIACLVVCAANMALSARGALAADPDDSKAQVRLAYSAHLLQDECPSEAAFRSRLISELGEDALSERATTVLSVEIGPLPPSPASGDDIRADVTLRAPDGNIAWQMRRAAANKDCRGLLDSVVLSLRVGIAHLRREGVVSDQEASASAAPEVPVAPEISPTTEAAAESSAARGEAPEAGAEQGTSLGPEYQNEPPRRERKKSWAELQGRLGVAMVVGNSPNVAALLLAGIGVRWPRVSVWIEPRVELPASDRQGLITFWLWEVSASPCVHQKIFFGCAFATVGQTFFESDQKLAFTNNGKARGGIGARAGTELRVTDRFTIVPFVELSTAAPVVRLYLNDIPVWDQAQVIGTFGVSLMGGLPATPERRESVNDD